MINLELKINKEELKSKLDIKDGADGTNGNDGSPDTPNQVVEKINSADTLIQKSKVEGLADIERMAIANSLPITTPFINGQRAKNLNVIGATVTVNGDTANVTLPSSGIPSSRTINTTAPLSGGGDLSVDRTLTTSMNTNKLIGRGTAGTGVMEEITLGTNLSLSGMTLNASGGGMAIGGAVSGGTSESILFIDGSDDLAQDNANFNYDSSVQAMGIGTANILWAGNAINSNITIKSAWPSITFQSTGVGTLWTLNSRSDTGHFILYDSTNLKETFNFSNNAFGMTAQFGDGAGTNGYLVMQANVITSGEFPGGNLFYNGSLTNASYTSMGFLPGTSGSNQKFVLLYFNITDGAYVSALEWSNTSGTGVKTNMFVLKSGGKFVIGSGSAGSSVLAVHGLPTSAAGLSTGDVWNNSGILTIV